MFDNNKIDKKIYSELMTELKLLNTEYRKLRKSKEYKSGKAVWMTLQSVKKLKISAARKQYIRWRQGVKAKKYATVVHNDFKAFEPDYFLNDRVAVYTVVFGNVDNILEPYCSPDNIDYYLITDQDIDLSKSKWNKVDISSFEDELKNMTNVQKNRFFKMKPYIVFPEYKYSIYIDGNIQVITDLTEYINRISSKCGLAAHFHSSRDCVYEESKAIIFAKKETKENMQMHLKHLEENGFPKHYGMLECNVLARVHNDFCKKIMEEWFSEFMSYSKRDQISLPFVLYNNHIPISEVATLGINVHENPSFRVLTHN